jgi:hypothetical protein
MVDVASGDLWFILCSERWCMMVDVTDPTLVHALVAEIGLSPYSMYPRPKTALANVIDCTELAYY